MPKLLRLKKIMLGLVFIIILSNLALFYYGFKLLQPVEPENVESQIIEIKQGESFAKIVDKLYEFDLIQDPLVFEIYLRAKGMTDKLQAGHYSLNTAMSAQEITEKIVKGDISTARISIPEGRRVYDIADRFTKQLEIERELFLDLVADMSLDFIPDNSDVNYKLEGFLFPETYEVPLNANETEIINLMLREFKEKIAPLEEEIERADYDLYEIITIASLIEAEVALVSEMPLVASVINNRLQQGMRLQLDATVQYVLAEHKARILYSDLRIESPYNTYLHTGLPPGPINNPGLEAIKAVLNPAETDYLYYVAAGDGGHIFTETYEEHLEAVQRVRSR